MQQTDKYKLNLIELSDNFSPDPINQNTQALETALAAETAQRTGETAALAQRVTVLEGHKVAVGTYKGNATSTSKTQTISLGFAPRVVLVQRPDANPYMATRDRPFHANSIVLTENGFRVDSTSTNVNINGDTYVYLAIK